MTTALAIITQALRESNLIAITATPTPEQITESLGKLTTLIASVFGFEVGTIIKEWPIGVTTGTDEVSPNWSASNWDTPPPNVRLVVTDPGSQTITLPPFPDNGARIDLLDLTGNLSAHPITLDGNGRLIEGVNMLAVAIDNANIQWMYRADLGQWVRITLISADTDVLPFPVQFDTYFETMLAMRLNPRYGRSASQETIAALQRSESQLRATYRQTRAVALDEAVLRRSETGYHVANDSYRRRRPDNWMCQ